MAKIIEDFKKFLFRGNLVELAVAFVMGAAFAALMKALVGDLFTPIISAIFGGTSFGGLTFSINGSQFAYGDFIDATLTFVATGFAVFFFIVQPYNALMARRTQEDPTTKDCPECTSAIPLGARRCPLCTSEIGEARA